MKRIFLVIGLVCGVFIFSGISNKLQSQELAGSLVYGEDIETMGLRVDGLYDFTDNLRGAADLTFFFPNETPGGADWNWWAININGHYILDTPEKFNVYGLAGLNFATVSFDFDGPGDFSTTDIGINLGGGFEYPVEFGDLFGEIKYTISEYSQAEINVGVRIPIHR